MNLRAARQQADFLIQSCGFSHPPIDVNWIAQTLGLHVLEDDLGQSVSGLLITTPNGSCIAVKGSDPPRRKRFTIAHEIGHHVLQHQFPGENVHADRGNYISARSPRSSEGTDAREVEANQFAASLLMPAEMLRERVSLIPGILLDSDVEALAEEFDVSEQAMTIRLSTLGLL